MEYFGDAYQAYYNAVNSGSVDASGHSPKYNERLRYNEAYYDSVYDS